MATITYYGLFGLTEKKPSGLFRVVKKGKVSYPEGLNDKGEWEFNPELSRHLNGYSDEAEEITEAEALKFIAKSRSP